MKRAVCLSAALLALDQAIKLIISHFIFNTSFVIVPGILSFQPVLNTNLTWIASMANYQTPVVLMVVLQVFFLAASVLVYRYLIYLLDTKRSIVNGFFAFVSAGICGSFIDVVFWSGSLDFVRLFDWFTFDFKDVYLSVCIVFLFVYLIGYQKAYHRLSKENRKQKGFLRWIKKGCPISQSSSL